MKEFEKTKELQKQVAEKKKRTEEKRKAGVEKWRASGGKKASCDVQGCEGQLLTCSTTAFGSVISGGRKIPLSKGCKVRTKKCTVCKKEIRTVEIPLEQYDKELQLIAEMKRAVKNYIHR